MDRATGFRVRDWACDYASFSLQELASITGLSSTHLRVWRSRGHLPNDLEALDLFTSRDVAEVLVRHRLTFGNIPPSESGDIGRQAAQSLLWHAIISHEVCELWGIKEDVHSVQSLFDEQKPTVAEDLTGLKHAQTYVWRPDRHEAVLQSDLAVFLSQSEHETHFLLDLDRLSTHLVTRTQRPLFRIDVSGIVSGRRVRGFA
jgi:hypothetical protein